MTKLDFGSGRTRLTLSWQWHGQDLSVHIAGGTDHVGAVALVGRDGSGDVFEGLLCLPPHKEGAMALDAARTLHQATGSTVCASAGIHLDDITQPEIDAVLTTARAGVAALLQRLGSRSPDNLSA